MALVDKKMWKEMVALGKELGLEGERLAEYVDRQTQLKLDQDAREEQRKMAAEAEQRKMAAEAEQRKMAAEAELR